MLSHRVRGRIAIAAMVSLGFSAAAAAQSPIPGVTVLDQPVPTKNGLTLIATITDPQAFLQAEQSLNVNAADTTNADVLQTAPYSLTGAGLSVGVWEAGSGRVRTTHQELTGRVVVGDPADPEAALSDHATHVAGTIAGTGIDAAAKGMATGATIRSYTTGYYDAVNDVYVDDDLTEMDADANLIVASNHSYGFIRGWTVLTWDTDTGPVVSRTWNADREFFTEDPSFGKYDSSVTALDTVLHDNPTLLSVWSAGNDRDESASKYAGSQGFGANTYVAYFSQGGDGIGDGGPTDDPPGYYIASTSSWPLPGQDGNSGAGYDSLPQNQVAKNSLTVGAINDLTAEGISRTGTMSNFSSWGPTDDGRIKPDVVGNGVSVYSSTSSANNAYSSFSGTSMAAPNVTGTMTLVIQRLQNVRGTSDKPLSATSKAIAIHTAHDVFTAGPDYTSGYGVVDGEAAVQFIDNTQGVLPSNHIIENSYDGSNDALNFVATGGAVKATLVWTDVEGAGNTGGLDETTLALINDLDLYITQGANTYFPWTLNPASPTSGAVRTVRNFRDNVEQVLIDNLVVGLPFTVHVDLTGALTGALQNWSLLVSGGLIPEPTAALVLASAALLLGRRHRRI